ncbi:hypothetical protein COS31_05665 [Candidatus Roizmanbacteria bacterium CG02_land_8_20_14_3_00_36_15]|uniref:Uncharacterized protein n=2 Tax=Candidatus Roizmaniibacteriota TaxID=1752723 RepID=A0A2M8KJV8_9BACT|nr:MAG: hypothetical protein COS51_01845 [Candidatus Roizmanbacteria bacterium CG03_land_8_20_14_0_80_36_21]PIV37250.1 MAG: hypothetical protein COS31_05665 [Candidatus Roizmanbacteria bacterium CG02_land_8_20_14_3_00_36_15]PJA53746.1 MAG: hypothetical protein CO166_00745 [Candidatus Roizmanbacteria bacterium CG_4_9_14_3_um_filter_36_11]PJE60209.1 MAG: hypothetical protein COU86_05595 [Candidatus Roizmanbacteria bacterium CG10_big_fil_rev_8_21_14_0_10_36_26]
MKDKVAREFMGKKLILPFILIVLLALIIFYIPPENSNIVILFIFLFSFLIYLSLSVLFNKKIGLISAFFVGLFLSVNYLVGFEIINTILLISLFFALKILMK